MGYGDDIMATGLARGFAERQKMAAFGDGRRIIWGPWSEEMFRYNINIARPEDVGKPNVEWVAHYKGCRMYNKQANGKWVWNYEFKPTPGEFYFNKAERDLAETYPGKFTVIEPNVPWQKTVASNKDWGEAKYATVCDQLIKRGHRIVQFVHKNTRRVLGGAETVELPHFRDVIAVLSKAQLYIGPEGGMHHAAAAVGVKGIVIFGGFIPPQVTGYDMHLNLTGTDQACGNIQPCVHCRKAMEKITVEEVIAGAINAVEM